MLRAQVMRYGEAMEIMKSNPMAKTILPRKKEKKLQYYTKEELQYFFECLEQYGNYKQLAFFRALAFTGCRKSEILSLQWEDIDLFNKTVSIGKTLAIDENLDIIIQTPKTSSSVREINLDDETIKILSRWRSIQREEYFQMGFNTTSNKQFVLRMYAMNCTTLKLLMTG